MYNIETLEFYKSIVSKGICRLTGKQESVTHEIV